MTIKSQNTIKDTTLQSGYIMAINPACVSDATYKFVQGYNSNGMKIDQAEANNNSLFQGIGLAAIPGQLQIVLAIAEFNNRQSKQTFKISCQRYFRNTFAGKALVITGNTCSVHLLAANETTDNKGKVIDLNSHEAKRIEAEKKAAERKALLLTAEQTAIALEQEKAAKKQAENSIALLSKKQNEHDKELGKVKAQADTELEKISAENKALKNQLERMKHETSATIKEYEALKAMILGKTTIQALRAKVSGTVLKSSKPEFTNKELIAAIA